MEEGEREQGLVSSTLQRTAPLQTVLHLEPNAKRELATKVITDTLNALPTKPAAVTHAFVPYVHLQQVADKSVDITLVQSFRAHFGSPEQQLSPAVDEQVPEGRAINLPLVRPARTELPSVLGNAMVNPGIPGAAQAGVTWQQGSAQLHAPQDLVAAAKASLPFPEAEPVQKRRIASPFVAGPQQQPRPAAAGLMPDGRMAEGSVPVGSVVIEEVGSDDERRGLPVSLSADVCAPSQQDALGQEAMQVDSYVPQATPATSAAATEVCGVAAFLAMPPTQGNPFHGTGHLPMHVQGADLAQQQAAQQQIQQQQQHSADQGALALQAANAPPVPAPRARGEWELDPGKISLGRRIAVGGFAEVFVGKYEGTLVAVKRLIAADAPTVAAFASEVQMLARVRHPNLLLFMGYTTRPEPCIILEFMPRGSLYHIMRQNAGRPAEMKLARAVALSVARGMAYLHSRAPPILHLDLKSPNILVDDRWRIKISDFGLSTVRQRTYVSSGNAGGTPEWMAPEVLRSEKYAEPADVYSYGVVLWELLTGHMPWESLNPMQVVGAVGFARKGLPPPPLEGNDPFLVELCNACRAYEPEARPTFGDIVTALDRHYAPASWGDISQPMLSPQPQQHVTPLAALPAPEQMMQPQHTTGNLKALSAPVDQPAHWEARQQQQQHSNAFEARLQADDEAGKASLAMLLQEQGQQQHDATGSAAGVHAQGQVRGMDTDMSAGMARDEALPMGGSHGVQSLPGQLQPPLYAAACRPNSDSSLSLPAADGSLLHLAAARARADRGSASVSGTPSSIAGSQGSGRGGGGSVYQSAGSMHVQGAASNHLQGPMQPESPRARRRNRSPMVVGQGEYDDDHGRPAVVTKLDDGRKTPSPRLFPFQSSGGGGLSRRMSTGTPPSSSHQLSQPINLSHNHSLSQGAIKGPSAAAAAAAGSSVRFPHSPFAILQDAPFSSGTASMDRMRVQAQAHQFVPSSLVHQPPEAAVSVSTNATPAGEVQSFSVQMQGQLETITSGSALEHQDAPHIESRRGRMQGLPSDGLKQHPLPQLPGPGQGQAAAAAVSSSNSAMPPMPQPPPGVAHSNSLQRHSLGALAAYTRMRSSQRPSHRRSSSAEVQVGSQQQLQQQRAMGQQRGPPGALALSHVQALQQQQQQKQQQQRPVPTTQLMQNSRGLQVGDSRSRLSYHSFEGHCRPMGQGPAAGQELASPLLLQEHLDSSAESLARLAGAGGSGSGSLNHSGSLNPRADDRDEPSLTLHDGLLDEREDHCYDGAPADLGNIGIFVMGMGQQPGRSGRYSRFLGGGATGSSKEVLAEVEKVNEHEFGFQLPEPDADGVQGSTPRMTMILTSRSSAQILNGQATGSMAGATGQGAQQDHEHAVGNGLQVQVLEPAVQPDTTQGRTLSPRGSAQDMEALERAFLAAQRARQQQHHQGTRLSELLVAHAAVNGAHGMQGLPGVHAYAPPASVGSASGRSSEGGGSEAAGATGQAGSGAGSAAGSRAGTATGMHRSQSQTYMSGRFRVTTTDAPPGASTASQQQQLASAGQQQAIGHTHASLNIASNAPSVTQTAMLAPTAVLQASSLSDPATAAMLQSFVSEVVAGAVASSPQRNAPSPSAAAAGVQGTSPARRIQGTSYCGSDGGSSGGVTPIMGSSSSGSPRGTDEGMVPGAVGIVNGQRVEGDVLAGSPPFHIPGLGGVKMFRKGRFFVHQSAAATAIPTTSTTTASASAPRSEASTDHESEGHENRDNRHAPMQPLAAVSNALSPGRSYPSGMAPGAPGVSAVAAGASPAAAGEHAAVAGVDASFGPLPLSIATHVAAPRSNCGSSSGAPSVAGGSSPRPRSPIASFRHAEAEQLGLQQLVQHANARLSQQQQQQVQLPQQQQQQQAVSLAAVEKPVAALPKKVSMGRFEVIEGSLPPPQQAYALLTPSPSLNASLLQPLAAAGAPSHGSAAAGMAGLGSMHASHSSAQLQQMAASTWQGQGGQPPQAPVSHGLHGTATQLQPSSSSLAVRASVPTPLSILSESALGAGASLSPSMQAGMQASLQGQSPGNVADAPSPRSASSPTAAAAAAAASNLPANPYGSGAGMQASLHGNPRGLPPLPHGQRPTQPIAITSAVQPMQADMQLAGSASLPLTATSAGSSLLASDVAGGACSVPKRMGRFLVRQEMSAGGAAASVGGFATGGEAGVFRQQATTDGTSVGPASPSASHQHQQHMLHVPGSGPMQQQQQQPQQLPIANSLPVAVPSGASTITSTRGHQAPAPVLIPQELLCFGLSTAPAAAGGTGTGIGALASSGGSFTRIKSKGRFTISEGDGGAPLCIVRATSPASASAPASVHAAAAPGSFDNDLDLGLLSSRSAPSGPCYIDPRASFEGPPGWPVSHPVPGTAGAGLSLPPASVLHADVNTAAGLVEAWPAGPPAAGTLLEQLPQSAAAPVAARGLPQQAQSQSALQLRLPQQDVPEQLGATQVQSDHGVPLQGDSAVQVQQEMERLVRERMRMYEERTAVLQDAANAADRQDSDQAPDDGDHAGPAVHAVHAAGPGQAQVLNLDVQIYNMQHASIAVDAAAGAGNGHGADAYMVDVDIHALQGEDPADAVQQPMHGSDSDESDSVMMEYEGAQGEDFDEVAMPNTPRPY